MTLEFIATADTVDTNSYNFKVTSRHVCISVNQYLIHIYKFTDISFEYDPASVI